MARLGTAIQAERDARNVVPFEPRVARRRYVAYLAMAALLALVTMSVMIAVRSRHTQPAQVVSIGTTDHLSNMAHRKADTTEEQNAEFEALSEEHFERSKLVVLGLATKDPSDRRASDWTYEREHASSLLNDTRMYRLAAEDRGLMNIAGVMRDLELVLLEVSMTDEKDPGALRQIQRAIQKRDLLEKMDAVAVPAAGRATGTKGI
jgi:hypothetical protein